MSEFLGWLGQNFVALMAVLGTVVVAYLGARQNKDRTGNREADQEEEIRNELRAANKDLEAEKKDLKAEIKASEAEKEQQKILIGQLERSNEQRQLLLDAAEGREKIAVEHNKEMDIEITKLKADVLRLTRRVTELETELDKARGQ